MSINPVERERCRAFLTFRRVSRGPRLLDGRVQGWTTLTIRARRTKKKKKFGSDTSLVTNIFSSRVSLDFNVWSKMFLMSKPRENIIFQKLELKLINRYLEYFFYLNKLLI